MQEREHKIAVGKDWAGWYKRFSRALDDSISQGIPISYDTINLESGSWLENVVPYDVVIWNPNYMGIKLASHLKEKIYLIETVLNKKVFPNFNTVWHFESKVAQSYLFNLYRIQTPKTFVTFDYSQAKTAVDTEKMPVVLKKSEGAGSSNVRLIQRRKRLNSIIETAFANQFWRDSHNKISKDEFILRNWNRKRFWYWLFTKIFHRSRADGVVYWQDYIPNNQADLRITVIGEYLAYGYWRNNRPHDFRASGSGLLDYQRKIPGEIVKYCMRINKELHFDSMCYDIIFSQDSFFITEMSYNYIANYLYNAPGYYRVNNDGELLFIQEHTWPEQLWIQWVLTQLGYLAPPC